MPAADESVRVIERLKEAADPRRLEGMSRFGIDTSRALGVSIPSLRAEARLLRKGRSQDARHVLALECWATGFHELRILASMVDSISLVDAAQMDAWAGDFNSWDLCDQCCNNLFRHTPQAWTKAREWAARGIEESEFLVRAGFVLMATLAVGDKLAKDESFLAFFPLLRTGCLDQRNYVKKAVSWALRQMGKRNRALHHEAVKLARWMVAQDAPAARWTGHDVLRDLERPNIQKKY